MANTPKEVILNLNVAQTHLKNAVKRLETILKSQNNEEICKYGESSLKYFKVICNNCLKSIDKITCNQRMIN